MQLALPVRLLGIDLGITSDHTAVVVDGAGGICARRRGRSTVASLAALEAAALATADPGTHLLVVIEPAGAGVASGGDILRPSGRGAADVAGLAEADLREVLPRIEVPTLLLTGDADRRSPPEVVARDLQGSRLEGGGHAWVGDQIDMESPDRANREVRGFLRPVHPTSSRKPSSTACQLNLQDRYWSFESSRMSWCS